MNWIDFKSYSHDLTGEVIILADQNLDQGFETDVPLKRQDPGALRAEQPYRDPALYIDTDVAVNRGDKDQKLFHAVIRPHRSASIGQIHIAVGAIGGLMLVLGIGFIFAGAWPITGFLGAEVLLLYLALSFHHGGKHAREELVLTARGLDILRQGPWRLTRSWQLSPSRMLVTLESKRGGSDQLTIKSGDQTVTIGACLSEAGKLDLARRLRFAIARTCV